MDKRIKLGLSWKIPKIALLCRCLNTVASAFVVLARQVLILLAPTCTKVWSTFFEPVTLLVAAGPVSIFTGIWVSSESVQSIKLWSPISNRGRTRVINKLLLVCLCSI